MVYRNCLFSGALYCLLVTTSFAQIDPEQVEWWQSQVTIGGVIVYDQDAYAICSDYIAELDQQNGGQINGTNVNFNEANFYFSNDEYVCVIEAIATEDTPFANIGDWMGGWNYKIYPVICQVGQLFNPTNNQCQTPPDCPEGSEFNPETWQCDLLPVECPDAGTPTGTFGPVQSTCIGNCLVQPSWPGVCNGNTFDFSCVTYTHTGQECTDGPPFPPNGCPAGGAFDQNGACQFPSEPPDCQGQTEYIDGGCKCPNGGAAVPENGYSCQYSPPEDPDPNPPDPPEYFPDTDGDGDPNNEDPDIDGDGVPNTEDPDIDGDGIPNDSDDDDDGDFIPDDNDQSPQGPDGSNGPGDNNCPAGTTYQNGHCQCDRSDEIYIGDRCVSQDPGDSNSDTDGDGIPDSDDDDIDGDGTPNDTDSDDDGDGVPDDQDDSQTGGGTCPQNYVVHQVNEETTICVPSPSVDVGSCDEQPICQADATDCAVIQILHEDRCQWDADQSEVDAAIDDAFAGDEQGFGDDEPIDLNQSLDIGSPGGTCPTFPDVSALGVNVPIFVDPLCDLAALLSPMVIVFSLLSAARIIYGGLTL